MCAVKGVVGDKPWGKWKRKASLLGCCELSGNLVDSGERERERFIYDT